MEVIFRSFRKFFSITEEYRDRRSVQLLLLGFSAGLPLALIFSSLSLWLQEAGLKKSLITFFSWAALGYSFKFIWSPLVDKLRIPFVTSVLGQRRSWLLLAQLLIAAAIIGMAMTNPALGKTSLIWLAVFAVLLGFSSATQDIVIDAFRIECAPESMQAVLSAMYIAGYRIGMIASGAGVLFLVSYFNDGVNAYIFSSWQKGYLCMALLLIVGIATTLSLKEPERKTEELAGVWQQVSLIVLFIAVVTAFVFVYRYIGSFYSQRPDFLSAIHDKNLRSFSLQLLRFGLALTAGYFLARVLVGFSFIEKNVLDKSYIQPITDFFERYPKDMAILLIAVVGFYRVSDIVLGVIANVFYKDMGFSLATIATAAKTYGVIATLSGGFVGGYLVIKHGVMRVLLLGAVLAAATNLLFVWLSYNPGNEHLLYLVITMDNLSVGIASTAFIAFMSSLTNISFTAVQYAIFSSVMSLFPKLLGGYSGTFVDTFGYAKFFSATALIGIPIIILIILIMRDSRFHSDPT